MRAGFGVLLAIAMAAIAPAALAPAAVAQTHSFVPLAGNRPDVAYFYDSASLKRQGDAAEFEILDVWTPQPKMTGEPTRRVTRYRISCDWGTTLAHLGQTLFDKNGKSTGSTPGDTGSQQNFYGSHGWHVHAAPLACNPAFVAPASAPRTVKDAIAYAAAHPGPPEPVRARQPFVFPGFPNLAASRFGVVKADKASGNVAFLDWGNLRRTGDIAEALVFEVLGDDTAPPPEPQWRFTMMAQRSMRFDCKARTATVLGYIGFGKSLGVETQDLMVWPTRSAADWPLGALFIDAACAGVEPKETFATRETAVAFQRKLHPLRK